MDKDQLVQRKAALQQEFERVAATAHRLQGAIALIDELLRQMPEEEEHGGNSSGDEHGE